MRKAEMGQGIPEQVKKILYCSEGHGGSTGKVEVRGESGDWRGKEWGTRTHRQLVHLGPKVHPCISRTQHKANAQ